EADEPETDMKPEHEPAAHGLKAKWRNLWRWMMSTTKGRMVAGIVAVALVGGAVAATPLRYPVVGLVYHNHGTVTVRDADTQQPLVDAVVSLGGQSVNTDMHGVASFDNLNLGNGTMKVVKAGYKTLTRKQLVPVGAFKATTVLLALDGTALSFSVTDKISGLPLDGATVTVGSTKAVAKDGGGRIVLPSGTAKLADGVVSKDNYLDGKLTFDLNKPHDTFKVELVPKGKVYFLSNRSGRIDIYSSNLDGSEAAVALAGTGKETQSVGILPNVNHPELLALVSTREGRVSGGYLQSDLFIYNTDTKQLKKIQENYTYSQFRAWVGDALVYTNPRTETEITWPYSNHTCVDLKAYQLTSQKTTTLYTCGYYQEVTPNVVYGDTLFYSVYGGPDASKAGFYAVRYDGANAKRIDTNPATSLSRQSNDALEAQYYSYEYNAPPPVWTTVNLENLSITKLGAAPAIQSYRSYVESASGDHTVFVDQRDGGNNLFLTDGQGQNEQQLTKTGDVGLFVQWIGDDYVVYSSQSKLYVVGTKGGNPVKITDFYATNTAVYGGGYSPNGY
ncbi:MAG TPA: hypothetical protein VLF67_03090, partial [Candidatus Saccharimonas sp.]|nr:hypothetical protein [Candidatus Saccharimonas sp.]